MARRRSTKRGKGEGSVFEQGSGVWRGKVTVGYDANGKQRFRWVSGKTQGEALAKIAEVKRQLATGTLSDTNLTVKAFLDKWLEHKARTVKPRSAEFYRYNAQKYLLPKIGRKKLDKLTPLEVQGLMTEIADAAGVSTANKCRSTLKAALAQAMKWQLLHTNVVDAVDKLPEKGREMILWTPAQAAYFLDTARPHRLYALFYLAMSTGMRRGELLGLRWQDVKDGALTIKQTIIPVGGKPVISEPKTAKGRRRVPLSPDVFAVLEDHHCQQEAERLAASAAWVELGLVFTTEVGSAIHPDALKRHWTALKKAANLPHIRLHDLRHLHVSLLIRQGIDARTIADRVGHSRTSMTLDVYAHLFDEQRAAAAISLLDLLPRSSPTALN